MSSDISHFHQTWSDTNLAEGVISVQRSLVELKGGIIEATLLLEIGTHLKIVQELLGHENIDMTMDIYFHVMPTMQKEAMAKLNELLGSSQQKDGGSIDRGEGEEEERS